jgi:chromosome segregation ATPase
VLKKQELVRLKCFWVESSQSKDLLKIAEGKVAQAKEELRVEEETQAPLRTDSNAKKRAAEAKKKDLDASDLAFTKADANRRKVADMLETTQKYIDEILEEKKDVVQRQDEHGSLLARFEDEVVKAEAELAAVPSDDDAKSKLREIEGSMKERRKEKEEITSEIQDVESEMQGAARQKEKLARQLENLRSVKRNRLVKASSGQSANRDAIAIFDWVERKRDQFEQPVFGPLFLEVTVENAAHSKFIDKAMNYTLKYAYVVTTQNDWSRIIDENKRLNLKCQVIDASRSRIRPHGLTDAELQQLGVAGYLDDTVQYSDDAVKAVLCDFANLHAIGYTARDMGDAVDKLSQRLRTLFTPTYEYSVKFSRCLHRLRATPRNTASCRATLGNVT